MGLWHIDTLNFGNVQHFQPASARIAILGFFLDRRLFSSRTRSRTAAPACVVGFCRHFLTPFLEEIKQPQPAALNYPFDFAFFAHEAPGRCPRTGLAEILTAPRSPVAKVMVDLGVAGLAQTHQVIVPMRPALREGNDVMDFLHWNQPSFLQTSLTQRMRRSLAVADSFPSSAVLLVAVGGTSVPVVLSAGGSFMLLTVLPIREVGTAGVGAWPLWFPWHRLTSLGHKKSPHRIAPMKAVLYSTSLL